MEEMKSGFGPMKTKNFSNAISSTVATACNASDLLILLFLTNELITFPAFLQYMA